MPPFGFLSLSFPNFGTWGRVRSDAVAVGIDRDSWVACELSAIVCHTLTAELPSGRPATKLTLCSVSGDCGKVVTGWLCGTTSSDFKLSAFGIELGGVGLVQSKQFVADQVVS